MRNEITQEFNDIVTGIDNTIKGTYDSATGRTNYCDTKWARKGKVVTDSGGNTFSIDTIVYDEYIIATQLSGTPGTNLDGITYLPTPFKLSGTKISTNNEWTISTPDITAKTPFVWLLKILSKNEFGREDARLFSSDLQIFFLDETNVTDFYSEDHTKEVVYPMERLCESFLKSVRSNRKYKTLEEYQKFYFDRFGVEGENGIVQNIIDANLSGVSLQLSLTKYKNNCKC